MRKVFAILSVFLLVGSLSFAQVPREAGSNATYTNREDTTTYFTNIGATGKGAVGNPGYLMLTGTSAASGSDTPVSWYVWVDDTGDLCMASYATISSYASFPNGNWQSANFGGACTKVGGQS